MPLPLAVIHLRGSQAAMGSAHGEISRQLGGFEPALDYYPDMATHLLVRGLRPGKRRQLLAAATRPYIEGALREMERRRPEDMRLRSRHFLGALGRDRAESRYLSIMDVFQNMIGQLGQAGIVPKRSAVAACTTAMCWGHDSQDAHLLHARNFDFPGRGIWDDAPTVVFCTPDRGLRYGFVSTRGADTPGITSFNEAGITVTIHTRFSPDVSYKGIGAIDLTHAISREATNLAEAVAIAARQPIASTWGIAVSSRDEERAIVIETSAAGVRILNPDVGDDHLTAANAYRHPDMQARELWISPLWPPHSSSREAIMRGRIRAARDEERATAELLARGLGSHTPVGGEAAKRGAGCLVSSPISVQSVVFDRHAESLFISVGPAPTGWGPYVRVPLSWDAPVGARLVDTDAATAIPFEAPFEGDEAEAFAAYLRAVDMHPVTTRTGPERDALRRAIRLSPSDPVYRFMAAGLAMQDGDLDDARVQLEAAIELERRPFRLAQYHMWGARVAAARGQGQSAFLFGKACCGSGAPETVPYRIQVERDRGQRWSRRRLKQVHLNYEMGDLDI